MKQVFHQLGHSLSPKPGGGGGGGRTKVQGHPLYTASSGQSGIHEILSQEISRMFKKKKSEVQDHFLLHKKNETLEANEMAYPVKALVTNLKT